jgi:hypothetical protein
MINTDMTTAEAERIYKEMEEMFGDKLPNLLHHPKQFAYYYKLYKLEKRNEHS